MIHTKTADYGLLDFAVRNGIIDLGAIQEIAMNKQREQFLSMHQRKIWKATNGYWYTELPPGPGQPKRRLVKKKNRADIDNAIIDHYSAQYGPPDFEKCFQSWLKDKVAYKEICVQTAERYRQDYNRFIKGSSLEHTPVENITEEALDDFIRTTVADLELTAKGYANLRTIIMGTLKWAKRKHYTQISASTFFADFDISRKKFKKPQKKKQVFTEAEAQTLCGYIKQHPTVMGYGIILAFQTGLRSGELAALKYSDVNGQWLHVQRQEIKFRAEGEKHYSFKVVDYTKTEAGDRRIALPAAALETIAALQELNPAGEYMLETEKGKIHKAIFNENLYKLCEACGIEKKSMHKIRKTYGTALLNSGADDIFTTRQMGHTDVNTTRRYYYDTEKNDDRYLETINQAIRF